MENNEMMTGIITTDAVTEVTEQVAPAAVKNHSGLKNAAIVGGIMALGALSWEFGVKPIARKAKNTWVSHKSKKMKKTYHTHLDTVPVDIDVDPEKQYPIK